MNRRIAAYIAVAVTTFGWALSPVFIRFLSKPYDPYSQAFIRYVGAVLLLGIIAGLRFRRETLDAFRHPATFGLAMTNALMQTAWTVGIYHSTATTAQFIAKLQVPFIILFSFFLFREERVVIRSPWFILGTVLGLLGVGGVLIEHPDATLLPKLDFSVMLLVFVAIAWAVYAVWGKHTVANLHPVPMFTAVAVYTMLYFAVLSVFFGSPGTLLQAGPRLTAIALISGTWPIAIAHCTFHYAQKHLGSALCSTLSMANPLITHFIAVLLWKNEAMNYIQWTGAAMLLTGSYMVVRAERLAAADGFQGAPY